MVWKHLRWSQRASMCQPLHNDLSRTEPRGAKDEGSLCGIVQGCLAATVLAQTSQCITSIVKTAGQFQQSKVGFSVISLKNSCNQFVAPFHTDHTCCKWSGEQSMSRSTIPRLPFNRSLDENRTWAGTQKRHMKINPAFKSCKGCSRITTSVQRHLHST